MRILHPRNPASRGEAIADASALSRFRRGSDVSRSVEEGASAASPIVHLVEEPPASGCAREAEQALAGQGFRINHLAWGEAVSFGERATSTAAVVVFPSTNTSGRPVLLEWIRQRDMMIPVVIVLPEFADDSTTAALVSAADDFLVAPVRADELFTRVRRVLRSQAHIEAIKNDLAIQFVERQLIGQCPTFVAAVERARLIAADGLPALITGETGTGKELFARAIHYFARRRQRPFIPVDCAALPDTLFENEMFGHERGAYTDARGRQEGLVSLASGGTLFLDEVNSLSMAQQAKLLRFLQDKTYRPLGSSIFLRADVSVIAATNRDLGQCVRAREFREDLYFRLNVLDLRVPPLRERLEDATLLARHFLAQVRPDRKFSPDALDRLSAYQWPGNVRELYNVVCRAAAFSTGPCVVASDLALPPDVAPRETLPGTFREARTRALENFERTYLSHLLTETRGNITEAARRAGKERRTIGRLVQKHQLKQRIV